MEDSSWGLIILVIVIILIIIVFIGIVIFRSVNKNPDNTESSIGNKCSSTVPCPEGLECSKFFCQNSGITTGEIGAFCLPDGQFPTTSGSSSPGCDKTTGLNCITNVCAKTTAGSVLNSYSKPSHNLTIADWGTEDQSIHPLEEVVIFSEPAPTGNQNGMTIGNSSKSFQRNGDGMTIGSVMNTIEYPEHDNVKTGIRFGPIQSRHNSHRYGRADDSRRSNSNYGKNMIARNNNDCSGRHNSRRFSGRHGSGRFSGRHSSGRFSGKHSSGGFSGRYEIEKNSDRYDSEENSGRYDTEGNSERYDSRSHISPERTNHIKRDILYQESWKVNQRGDVDHYNYKNQEWECIFPSGFNWLVGRNVTGLTAKCISILKSDSGDENVVVSFRSSNSEFPHSLFYEIITNQGPGRPYILIPWTTYRSGEFNGQIFCPTQEVNYERDDPSKPKWVPIVGSKIKLQEDGKLWIQGHMAGSNYPQLFVPSSTDQSKEYLARDGQLY